MSEEFIEEFSDYINWNTLSCSRYVNMSEKFIEKHIDKLDINPIVVYQKLSESFIKKYKDKIDLDYIDYNYLFVDMLQDSVKNVMKDEIELIKMNDNIDIE